MWFQCTGLGMISAGIDIGGTKIEARVFASDWSELARHRVPTPDSYPALVASVAEQIKWADGVTSPVKAVGIGAAGLVHPETGLVLAANLAASGRPFPADIVAAANRPITYINDSSAMVLSEAIFGAGQGHRTVMGVIIGTGIGGGVVVDGTLLTGPTATAGEFGHIAAPAHLVVAHQLPIFECGCGRKGCIETYVAGPGLVRLAKHMTGEDLSPAEIAAARHKEMGAVWTLWCQLAGAWLNGLTLTVDPDVIVLGGGLSTVPGIAQDLMKHAQAAQIPGFDGAHIVVAIAGDASGTRGAAYAARATQTND